jgi:hypothetical protein
LVSEIDPNIPPASALEVSPVPAVPAAVPKNVPEELPTPALTAKGAADELLASPATPVAEPPGPPPSTPARVNVLLPVAVAVSAWAVPGLGHLLLGRWGRALTFLVAVAGLGLTGLALRGNVFHLQPGGFRSDPFNFLGSVADLGMGGLYFISQWFQKAGADVSRAAGDYGTRLIATAGIINFLAAFDAYEIASHKKD